MRVPAIVLALPALLLGSVSPRAQDRFVPGRSQPTQATKPAELTEQEIGGRVAKGRERQEASDRRTSRLWERWIYAVCIGCGPLPGRFRAVYTNPGRVLAGIAAADDDERARRGVRI